MKTSEPPIGLALSQTAKAVTRGFEHCLNSAGGTLSTWLILQTLIDENGMLQTELAQKIGIQGSTLTHHLNSMDDQGLITRTRLISDRRSHRVDLTEAGHSVYQKLRQSAVDYDSKINEVFSSSEMALLRTYLFRLAEAGRT